LLWQKKTGSDAGFLLLSFYRLSAAASGVKSTRWVKT
jgi:hypothetical protein